MARTTSKNKASLAPITKTHPYRISENENLEKYEQIVEKMSDASGEIIDRVLDRLEGKPTKPVKSETTQKPETDRDCKTPEEPHPAKEAAAEPDPLERAYVQLERNYAALKAKNAELEGILNEKNELNAKLTDETQTLKNKIAELEAAVSELRNSGVGAVLADDIKKAVEKSDDLLLRNSELEFEISRLGAENHTLKQKLENLANAKKMAGR